MAHWYDGWTLKDVFGPSIVFGLLIALPGWFFARRGAKHTEPKAELSFGVIGQRVVAGSAESVAGKVKIIFDGQEVGRLSRVFIAWMNTGDLPVKATDFEGEMMVTLSGVKRLFSAQLSHSFPSSLAPSVSLRGNDVTISPVLLNSGDYVVVELVVESFERVTASLRARVCGVSEFPVLRAGSHPGYDVGGQIFWGTMALVSLAAVCAGVYQHNYFLWIMWLTFAAASFALYQYRNENRVTRRLRFMGQQTATIAAVDGIPEK
ncbi:hypothetical protein AB4076_11010 [Dyella sp. 2RAF44]|uniref:hypothetical protein n=1 Tax=Dyella sp. 2RAF44 TaxID=3233000 RepID=UPI003F93AE45